MPAINREITSRRHRDIDKELQAEIALEMNAALDRILEKHGRDNAGPANIAIYIPFGPIILVCGLWLIARKEPHKDTEQDNRAYR